MKKNRTITMGAVAALFLTMGTVTVFAATTQNTDQPEKLAEAQTVEGKMVRYFMDILNSQGEMNGFSYEDGVLDLKAVRDTNYELTGLNTASQEEYDSRTISIKKNGTSGISGEDICIEGMAGDPDGNRSFLQEYTSLGISYDKASDNWQYNGKPIHLLDDANDTFVDNAVTDGIWK